MANIRQNNTNVTIVGKLVKNKGVAYERDGEKFYEILIKVTGFQTAVLGVVTVLPIIIPERMLENAQACQGTRVSVVAYMYSRIQKGTDGRSHFQFELRAQSLLPYTEGKDQVVASLIGYLCKPLMVKKADDGKTVSHALICVSRDERISDYFPILCTRIMAKKLKKISIGDSIATIGVIKGYPSEESGEEVLKIIMTNCKKIPQKKQD